jgi:hypothetical protein
MARRCGAAFAAGAPTDPGYFRTLNLLLPLDETTPHPISSEGVGGRPVVTLVRSAHSVERIERLAVFSVRRGCGFAALAICTTMFALVEQPALAFRTGALLCCLAAAILFWKGRCARTQNHRETELWILLDRNPGLPEAYAGRVINAVLSSVYMRHAEYAALIAFLLWLVSLVVG